MCKGILVNVASVEATDALIGKRMIEAQANDESAALGFWWACAADLLLIKQIRILRALASRRTSQELAELHSVRAQRQVYAALYPELAPFDVGLYCIAYLYERHGDYWPQIWDSVMQRDLYAGPVSTALVAHEKLRHLAQEE